MAEHEYYFFLKDMFPHAGAELLRLLQGAAENANLLRSDFAAIADWLEIAGYADDETAHAILVLLLVALEEGSVCIETAPPALRGRLADLVPEAEASMWAERIHKAQAFPNLIGASPDDHKPVIAQEANGRRFFYFQRFLRAELDFQKHLQQRLAATLPAAAVDWEPIVQDVLGSQPLKLDADQVLALETALHAPFAVISGGPGTGKTSIVLTLLRCLARAGVAPARIALAAPTGRAAQRLTDAIRAGIARLSANPADLALRDVSASTLHQLLAYRPHRNIFARHEENPIPADIVIVDEVSMVGLVLMSTLLKALAPETKLVLLGDKDQLPSVDAGAVLAGLIPENSVTGGQRPAVLLRTNHRSQPAIRAAAAAINQRDATVPDRLPILSLSDSARPTLEKYDGCYLLEQTLATSAELRGFLHHWAEHAYFHSKFNGASLAELLESDVVIDADRQQALFAMLDRFRLLTLVRDGAWGCDDINAFLDMRLRPRLDGVTRSGLFAGAPVLITRNDTARGLFNGDVGIAIRDRGGALRVLFQRQVGAASFPAESLPAHQLGFALTVHKSQGSEYENVMVVLPPRTGRRLLTKELIYTAITRAKKLAVVCSTKEALRFAIGRRIVRESGLVSPLPSDEEG